MRTWTGCLTCRSRKIKCDERRPKCRNCEKNRVQCIPSDLFSFKHWRNPLVSKNAKSAGSGTFELDHIWVDVIPSYRFVDETSTIAGEYQDVFGETSGITGEYQNTVYGSRNWGPGESDGAEVHHRNYYDPVHSAEGEKIAATPIQAGLKPQAPASSVTDWNFSVVDTREVSTSSSDQITSSSRDYPVSFNPENVDVDSQVHLPQPSAALGDTLASLPANTPNSLETSSQRTDAAGEALLSMRNHDMNTQITGSLSNNSYPSMERSPSDWGLNSVISPTVGVLAPTAKTSPGRLTSKGEADLLRQFSAEVGTWMDLSDLSETFSKKVCRLAVHDPLLKAASIACAAKQQYLVGKLEDGMQVARKNYDTAISLLINQLWDLGEQVAGYGFAAIVICSCYEMLDAPTANWQRHLDGVFSFGRVQSVNGSSGGISQAAFWSIARQEVVCAIINRSKLRLDPDFWVIDLENIGQEGSEDLVNNQVLTILAKVVNYMALSETYTLTRKIEEWHNLHHLLEHWNGSVKDKGFMDPVSVIDEEGRGFQTIWFARSVCASSWQMFHLAQILLLTISPLQDSNCLLALRKIQAKLLYHARQICGIAQSKPDGSCRVNSVQPIYFAGCCFDKEHERKAAATLLEDIENELGWAAIYRARDLYALWGWHQ